jgi:hypothetical protein
MAFDMPREARGRSTVKQRAQYYGWHLVAKPNMQLNRVPREQQAFLQQLFLGKTTPSPAQAQKFLGLVSVDGGKAGRATLVAKMRLDRILGDTQILKNQIRTGEYTPQTAEIFEESVRTFEHNLKQLRAELSKLKN